MAELTSPVRHEVVIEPWRGWFHLPWQELWEYRDLLVMLIQRDFTARYKQTILGPLWFILQPVLTTAMFVLVFGRVVGISTNGLPPVLFYFCGITVWGYFAQNVTNSSMTFTANAHLFGKVYFPRLVVPAGIVISNLAALALQIPLFFLIFAYYRFCTVAGSGLHFTWALLLFPLLLAQISLLSFGVGLWLSSASAKYRDLAHLNAFLIQLWMFATPVIYPLSYPLSKLPPGLAWLVYLNPMAPLVEACRISLLGLGTVDRLGLEISVALTVLILLTGVAFFQRCERTAMDNV